jgi:hypothetical protein
MRVIITIDPEDPHRDLVRDDAESWLGDREAEEWEDSLAKLHAAVRDSTLHSDTSVDAILRDLEG